jgi:hypothetical protein
MRTAKSRASLLYSVRRSLTPQRKRLLVDPMMGGLIGLLTLAVCAAPWPAFFRPLPVALKILLNPLACGVLPCLPSICSPQNPFLPGQVLGVPPRPSRLASASKADRQHLLALLKGLPALICLKVPSCTIRFGNRRFRTGYGDPGDRLYYNVVHGRATTCESRPTAF